MTLKEQYPSYKFSRKNIFAISFVLIVLSFFTALMLGEVLLPESNVPRPDLLGQLLYLVIISLILAGLFSVMMGFTRWLSSSRFLASNKKSYKAMSLVSVMGFVLLTYSLAKELFYRPTVDGGFIIFLIGILPLVGFMFRRTK